MMKMVRLFHIFSTFVSVFASTKNSSQMINFHEQSSTVSDIYGNLTQILTSCKNNHASLVILMDALPNINKKWLTNLHTRYSVIIWLFNEPGPHQYLPWDRISKSKLFVYAIPSRLLLNELLKFSFHGGQSNAHVTLYILNTSVNGCEMAKTLFDAAWEYNILEVYLICSNNHNEVKIYTYNYLTYRKPERWELTQEGYHNESRDLIYKRDCQEVVICENLYFDRTKFLDKYEVVIGIPEKTGVPISRNHSEFTFITDLTFVRHLKTAFNTYISLFTFQQVPDKKYLLNPDLMYKYLFQLMERKKAHLLFSYMSIEFPMDFRFQTTYPIAYFDSRIISYNRGYQTPIEKICDFYGIWTLLFTVFILTLVFIVIWNGEKKKIAFAFYETIRLLISHSLYTQMRSLPIRIFFGVVFIYFLIIQATFSGNLAKFLTKPELRKHFETLEDLQHVDKNLIFYPPDVRMRLEKSYSAVKLEERCINHIISNDTSAVCINTYTALFPSVYNNTKLYISKKFGGNNYIAHLMPSSSPINERLYKYFIWYTDLGIIQLINKFYYKFKTYMHKMPIESKVHHGFNPINVDNLMFSFTFLAIGLIIASISFCIEICYAKLEKRKILGNGEMSKLIHRITNKWR